MWREIYHQNLRRYIPQPLRRHLLALNAWWGAVPIWWRQAEDGGVVSPYDWHASQTTPTTCPPLPGGLTRQAVWRQRGDVGLLGLTCRSPHLKQTTDDVGDGPRLHAERPSPALGVS